MAKTPTFMRASDLASTQIEFANDTALKKRFVKPQVAERNFDLSAVVAASPGVFATASDVQDQQLVVGIVENNVTVAERLRASPAQNARQFSESGLRDLALRLLALNPKDKAFVGVNLRDITIAGFSKSQGGDVTLGEIIDGGGLGSGSPIKFNSASAVSPNATDQAAHFYLAVSAVDNNVIILRQVETRVAEYKRLLEEAKNLQSQILDWQAQADSRLIAINGEIESARHHISIAQKLKDEEKARVAAVNAKRKAILDRVEVVLFHKPRMANRYTPLPVTEASSATVGGKLQLPLRELVGVPQEISDMVHNFRAAPLQWFPALEGLPQFFDRPAMLFNAFEHVRLRAASPALINYQIPKGGGAFIGAARNMIGLQSTRMLDWRKAGLLLDTQLIDLEGLSACHRRLRQAATLGDMIDGGHGSAKASKMAAGQLDDLGKAAESLYASFADTPAEKRLAWAEALVEDSGQASFRALHTLPGWLSIAVDLRREQQGLVDLLYQHVHAENAEAVTAINRLILVALLVAAHAPVSQLIGAKLVRPVIAQPGVIFDLTMDLSKVRVGMAVTVQNKPGEIAARAVIDDIVGGRARARLVEAAIPNITLGLDAIVQLSESQAFKTSVVGNRRVKFR